MLENAIGLIETLGLTAAIAATDAASKAAAISIIGVEYGEGGYVSVRFEGELGPVQAAAQAGAEAARRVGQLVSVHVIPRPDAELEPLLSGRSGATEPARMARRERAAKPPVEAPRPSRQPKEARHAPAARVSSSGRAEKAPAPTAKEPPRQPEAERPLAAATRRPSNAELEAMPVVKLRQYARTVEALPIKGREISMANKSQLMEALRRVFNTDA